MEAALPNYEIGAEIGRGAFGIVYRGHHRHLDRDVALKQLPRALAADPGVQQRFVSEARTIASLQHPHIVPVHDFVERDGLCVLVMELMDGGTLSERVRAGLSATDACSAMADVLDALQFAHDAGVVHRDIKPDNVLYNAQGVAKLGDFGIAKIVGDTSGLTAAGTVVGTPSFMSPEVASGEEATPLSDVYSAAASLYEALSGALPFPGATSATSTLLAIVNDEPMPLAEAAPSVPAAIAATIIRGLVRDPAQRHPSAAAFARSLRAAVNGDQALPPPGPAAGAPVLDAIDPRATVPPRGIPAVAAATTSRRSRRLLAAVAAAAVVIVGVVAAIVISSSGDDDQAAAASTDTADPADGSTATEPSEPETTVVVSSIPAPVSATTPSAASTPAATAAGSATTDAEPEAVTVPSFDLTASTVLEDYNVAVAWFRDACDGRSITPDQCECILDRVVNDLGAKRFVVMVNVLIYDQKLGPETSAIVNQCLAEFN